MILNVCREAGVDPKQITPNMLSRYGMMHSYLLYTNRAEATELSALDARTPEQEAALAEANRRIDQLTAIGEIGSWTDRYPVPLQERIDSVIRYLGEPFLYKAVGI